MPFIISEVTKRCSIPLLGCLFIVTLPFCPKALFTITANNRALVGFAYRTIENADWLDCIQACLTEVSCISYNFWQGRCELNNCDFEDGCSSENTLIWVPGSTFQKLALVQDENSRCKDKRVNFKKSEIVMVNASFSCTQNMSVYVDGNSATFLNSRKPVKDIDCSILQPHAVNFAITNSTQVVAIAAMGVNVNASIIGSFSDGVVTDSTWKCTSKRDRGWALPGFNDDHWEEAKETLAMKGGTNVIKRISLNAEWISAHDSTQEMYCRLRRKIESRN